MRRFHALVVFDDVFMLEELHHFDFAVKELAQEFIRNVVLRHDFDGDHRLVALGKSELRGNVTFGWIRKHVVGVFSALA